MTRARNSWSQALETSVLLVSLLFLVALLDRMLPLDLRALGVLPRTLPGLVGILCSPLLHMNGAHLMANAVPFFVLLFVLFWDRRYHPERTLMWIWIGSGAGTWLIGRGNTIHIGASSVIYGLVVYLIAAGWWMRNWRAMAVAVLVLIFYGGIFYGVLPQRGFVSWEGHLAGAIAGWAVAKWNHS